MDGYTVVIWLVIIIIISKRFLKSKLYPPGPFSLPILGNFLRIASALYLQNLYFYELLSEWAGRYGRVVSFWLGNQLIVVVNEAKLAKTVFSGDDVAARPAIPTFEKVTKGYGVALSSGPVWREQRKFTLEVFSRLGIGKVSFEQWISAEVGHLTREFQAQHSAFNPQELLNKAASNVISSIVLGRRFSYDDKEFNNITKRMQKNLQIVGAGGALLTVPLLKYAPAMSNLVNEYSKNFNESASYLTDIVTKHKEHVGKNNPIDFIDAWLIEAEKRKSEESDISGLSEENLIVTIMDLFASGAEPVSASLSWFILYMVKYPEIQRKVQQEIDSVVGKIRLPQVTDKADLPYTEATMLEVMRIQTATPVVPHCATRHTMIQGYRIPKDAVILSNLWHMSHDAEIWDAPEDFLPERFIDDDGKMDRKPDVMIPFGIGQRSCLGEQLAKMELFLFITNLMHRFTFELPKGSPPIVMRGGSGISNMPQPYEIKIAGRHKSASGKK